jgi:hypothetical protein
MSIQECRRRVQLAMNANFITLFVRLPKKAVWLVVKIWIMRWITEFFPNKGHEGAVIKIENYLALGARVFHTMVEWNCN